MQFVIFHRLPNGEIELAYEPASDDEDEITVPILTGNQVTASFPLTEHA
jgi:hypothetical protein